MRTILSLLFLLLLPAPAAAQAAAKVAAAADLQYALPEIAAAYTAAGGTAPQLSFGSSGVFAHQIINGAPFEIFLSADESYVALVDKAGRAEDSGRPYATGRLALFIAKGAPIAADRDLADLGRAAGDGRLKRLAIANPEHAPYGRAARAVLVRKGLWETLQPRLVLGENISQAAQFAISGTVQAGLIAYSLAISDRMARRGSYALVPQEWYPPLRQRMVLLTGAGETARRFYAFVQSAPARAALERYGFALPPPGN